MLIHVQNFENLLSLEIPHIQIVTKRFLPYTQPIHNPCNLSTQLTIHTTNPTLPHHKKPQKLTTIKTHSSPPHPPHAAPQAHSTHPYHQHKPYSHRRVSSHQSSTPYPNPKSNRLQTPASQAQSSASLAQSRHYSRGASNFHLVVAGLHPFRILLTSMVFQRLRRQTRELRSSLKQTKRRRIRPRERDIGGVCQSRAW